MTTLAVRDRLGARRVFVHPESGAHAGDLHTLLALVPSARRAGLDLQGVDAAWGLIYAPDRTCLAAVRAAPPGGASVGAAASLQTDLEPLLLQAVKRALSSSKRPVVALGGGIDAPLAVLASRRAGLAVEHAIHLSVPGTPYDESLAARESAEALGLTLHEIRLSITELAAELPRAVRMAETPLYNLHPVSRAVVARVARERGHDALLSGDGADQAARGATEPADYVPVVTAITRAAGLAPASPFIDDDVVELMIRSGDPEKRVLRVLAEAWGLPRAITNRPKFTCWAPPLPRDSFPDAAAVERLARALDRALAWSDDDRRNVGIASLVAFVAAFEIEEPTHAARGSR